MKNLLLLLFACCSAPTLADDSQLTAMPPPALQARQRADLDAVLRYRNGLRQIVEFAAAQPQLFPNNPPSGIRLLSLEQREAVRGLWQRMLDYYLALDSIGRLHADFHRLTEARLRASSFQVGHAAFLAQYRAALEFIAATRHEPGLDILLNEAMPALGVPAGSFDRFKLRFLNAARATEFGARELLRRHYLPAEAGLQQALGEDAEAILRHAQDSGVALTFVNALDIVRKTGFEAWFPVQAGVAEWMGDTRVHRPQRSLISAAQATALPDRLEPGDILIERREWYLSNVGLPGFWPHAALYVGSAEERDRYFDTAEVRDWVRSQGEPSGRFEQLLARRHPAAQAASGEPREHRHLARVLEAISEGVSFTSIEHSADADSLAVLRPRTPRIEKAQALLRAFGYFGRPYDFNFDFRSDSALVCSELVFKAYEPGIEQRGLRFPLSEVLGRLATSPNDLVRQFDEQFGSAAQQTDLVLFLDGQEKAGRATEASLEDFRASWRRPKWHILTQSLAER